MKLIVFLSVIALAAGAKVKSQQNPITQQNTDLFKYSPNDIYSLPEDIDDDSDKAPVIFNGDSKNAKISKLENINSGRGKFKVSLKTENGIEVDQAGKLKDDKTFVISGSYTYTGADGKRYRVRYTADELGYHPITELDVEVPDQKQPSATASKLNGLGAGLDKNNGFQFLNRPIGGGNSETGGNAETFGNQGSSSNTVVHQKGQGYSFESSGSPLGGLTAPGYGSLGSASVQSTVVKGGSSTLSSFGHGSQSAGNGVQGSTSFGSVASQGSSGSGSSSFGSGAHGSSSFGSVSSQGSSGNGAHGSSSFGSVSSQGSSGNGAHGSSSFGGVASHGSSGNGAHGSSSFGGVASHGSSGSSFSQGSLGNGAHGSSSFGSVSSQGSSGNGAHGTSSFGSVSSQGSSGNGAHGSSSFGSVASQGSLGNGVHSTSFGTGANGAHGSGVSSFSSVSKGPQGSSSFGQQTVSTFGSVSKGPQTASTFSSVSKGPQTSSFSSVSKGPQTSTFSSVSKGPQGGSGVSVSGGSFAGNAGQGSFSSGHVSVSTGSGHGGDRKTAASHHVETYESGLNTDVFSQIEHHNEDGYNYAPPKNQYLPPVSQPIGHQPHSEVAYLPPLKK